MNAIGRTIGLRALDVPTAVTMIIAGWFALTLAVTVGGLVAGA